MHILESQNNSWFVVYEKFHYSGILLIYMLGSLVEFTISNLEELGLVYLKKLQFCRVPFAFNFDIL